MRVRLQSAIALLVTIPLCLPACATSSGVRLSAFQSAPSSGRTQQTPDPALLADYLQRLPVGSTIRVARIRGGTIKGTLMKVTDKEVVVQPRTRLPEPPIQIALADVVSIVPDNAGGNGPNIMKAIGIGVAAGAAAALGIIVLLIVALD